MSLRFRLIGLVAIVLVASLVFGGVIAVFTASRSVQTEMQSALLVGRQTVENAVLELPKSRDPRHDLENLIASFRGNRHLHVALTGDAGAVAEPAVEAPPFGSIPDWFVRLIGVAPVTERLPVAAGSQSYGSVVIETDPHNEILEVWNWFTDTLIMLAAFCVPTIALIYLLIGRALRPLDRLASALQQVGRGDYGARIDIPLAPEIARLRDSFNRMAERLAEMDADNRRLNEQLLTLQEQERSELARDLHDEVSPFLFAINVDVGNISRLAKDKPMAELPAIVDSISEAVEHIQQVVRNMLGRLRPIGLADFGLNAAIANMVEFWSRRHPDIDFQVTIAPDCDALGDLADKTVFRVVQECLSNAVRHGKPTAVKISVSRTGDAETGRHDVVAEVADNGSGIGESAGLGYGLLGMNERVKAMGGRLTIANMPDGGLTVTATLPCAAPARELVPALRMSQS